MHKIKTAEPKVVWKSNSILGEGTLWVKEHNSIYFVDIKNKKILEKIELKTNSSNFLEIPSTLISPEIYIITDKFLGVPIFLSEHNGHLSFEHTHPPHEYFLSKNKFEQVSKLKKEIYEIIN